MKPRGRGHRLGLPRRRSGANLGLGRDVTERKRIERELAETTRRTTVFRCHSGPGVLQGQGGALPGDQQGLYPVFGQTREFLVGKSVFDCFPRELAEIYHARDKELFDQPAVQVYEAQIEDTAGVRHDVMFHKASFLDAEGRVAGLIGAILDITGRKQAEQAPEGQRGTCRNLAAMLRRMRQRARHDLGQRIWTGATFSPTRRSATNCSTPPIPPNPKARPTSSSPGGSARAIRKTPPGTPSARSARTATPPPWPGAKRRPSSEFGHLKGRMVYLEVPRRRSTTKPARSSAPSVRPGHLTERKQIEEELGNIGTTWKSLVADRTAALSIARRPPGGRQPGPRAASWPT